MADKHDTVESFVCTGREPVHIDNFVFESFIYKIQKFPANFRNILPAVFSWTLLCYVRLIANYSEIMKKDQWLKKEKLQWNVHAGQSASLH